MKKLLVKAQFITTSFSPAIPAQPEKWVKDELEFFELPETPEEYVYYPAIEAVSEVAEVKEWKVIAQTQGPEEELQVWLETDKHKYPEGYVVEWIDLESDYSYQLQKCIEARKAEYPDAPEFLNAFFDGGEAALEELKEKRLAIKAKYPKPSQE